MENREWATWFTILHSAPIQQKSHRIIQYGGFYSIIF